MNLPSELRRIAKQLDFTEDDKAIVLLAAKVLRIDREPLAVLNLINVANEAATGLDILGATPNDLQDKLRKAVKAVEGEWDG